MGSESAVFEFQGNKLLEEATNTDARHSNFNHTLGDQYIVDTDANTVVVIKNVAIIIENVPERTLS